MVVIAVGVIAGAVVATQPSVRLALGLVRTVPYTNPVLDADFPDPALLQVADGTWYAYATQTIGEDGADINLQVARSVDLVSWTLLGDALPVKPTWAASTQDYWAPHVVERDGRFVMYYSADPDGSEGGLCLAVATADDPAGPFTDVGQPLECGDGFINIDPMPFLDPADGRWLLFWGSGFDPIRVRELAPDGLAWAAGSEPTVVLEPDAFAEYENLVEGVWVVHRDDWYYLFYAGDSCCSSPHYAVLVARSRAATGPYEKLAEATGAESSAIVEADDIWNAPGHNSVVTDAAGRDWLVYHAIDRKRPFQSTEFALSRRMLIDPIEWVDGWPRVMGGVPSSGERPGPAQP